MVSMTDSLLRPFRAIEALATDIEPLLPILQKLEKVAADPAPKEEREAIRKAIGEPETVSLSADVVKLTQTLVPSLQTLHECAKKLPTEKDLDSRLERVTGLLSGLVNAAANRVVAETTDKVNGAVSSATDLLGVAAEDATRDVTRAVNHGVDRVGQTVAEASVDFTRTVNDRASRVDRALVEASDRVGQVVGHGMTQVGQAVARACGDVKGLVTHAGGYIEHAIADMDKSVSGVKDAMAAVDTSTTQLNEMLAAKLAQVLTVAQGQELVSSVQSTITTRVEDLAKKTADLQNQVEESCQTVLGRIDTLPAAADVTAAVCQRDEAMVAGFNTCISGIREHCDERLSVMHTHHRDVLSQVHNLQRQLNQFETSAIHESMAAKARYDAEVRVNKAQHQAKLLRLMRQELDLESTRARELLSHEEEIQVYMKSQQEEHEKALAAQQWEHDKALEIHQLESQHALVMQQWENDGALKAQQLEHQHALMAQQQQHHNEEVKLVQLTESLRFEREKQAEAAREAELSLHRAAEDLTVAQSSVVKIQGEADAYSILIDEQEDTCRSQNKRIQDLMDQIQDCEKVTEEMRCKAEDQATTITAMTAKAHEHTNTIDGMEKKVQDQARVIQDMKDQARVQHELDAKMQQKFQEQSKTIADLTEKVRQAAKFQSDYQSMEREKNEALAQLQAMRPLQPTPSSTESGPILNHLHVLFSDLGQEFLNIPHEIQDANLGHQWVQHFILDAGLVNMKRFLGEATVGYSYCVREVCEGWEKARSFEGNRCTRPRHSQCATVKVAVRNQERRLQFNHQ